MTLHDFAHRWDAIPHPKAPATDIPWCAAVERLSNGVERMIQIQMTAFPESWSEEDRREMAERALGIFDPVDWREGRPDDAFGDQFDGTQDQAA